MATVVIRNLPGIRDSPTIKQELVTLNRFAVGKEGRSLAVSEDLLAQNRNQWSPFCQDPVDLEAALDRRWDAPEWTGRDCNREI